MGKHSAWIKLVQKTYRANKKKGMKWAMKDAKRHYVKKKKKGCK